MSDDIQELSKAIDALIADRDRWRAIAQRAMSNCDEAIAILEAIQKAVHK
jgi:outer membrane murein-binding lipoprotein Lpp